MQSIEFVLCTNVDLKGNKCEDLDKIRTLLNVDYVELSITLKEYNYKNNEIHKNVIKYPIYLSNTTVNVNQILIKGIK